MLCLLANKLGCGSHDEVRQETDRSFHEQQSWEGKTNENQEPTEQYEAADE